MSRKTSKNMKNRRIHRCICPYFPCSSFV
ncbi:hypothetical protein [Chryseobacterium glaciei]